MIGRGLIFGMAALFLTPAVASADKRAPARKEVAGKKQRAYPTARRKRAGEPSLGGLTFAD